MTREPALSVSCADSSPIGGAKDGECAPYKIRVGGGCHHPPGR
nr:MAG TPA: hypothetical protein [Caudoviricetes sp.]